MFSGELCKYIVHAKTLVVSWDDNNYRDIVLLFSLQFHYTNLNCMHQRIVTVLHKQNAKFFQKQAYAKSRSVTKRKNDTFK